MISCALEYDDQDNLSTDYQNELYSNHSDYFKDSGCDPKEGKITFVGKLHRGKKWSERNNVPSCTQSFGICNFKFEKVTVKCSDGREINVKPSASFKSQTQQETTDFLIEPLSATIWRLSFVESRKQEHSGVFISSEDDNILIPEEISEIFGYTGELYIKANDYLFKETNEYPFGYVDLEMIE